MKRLKVELIYHISDSDNAETFGDRIADYIGNYKPPFRSANDKAPFYESCEVSIERKTWDQVVLDTKRKGAKP